MLGVVPGYELRRLDASHTHAPQGFNVAPQIAICLYSPASVPSCCLVCAATYLKKLNLKVGDVIAVRRREDGALVSLLAGACSMSPLQPDCGCPAGLTAQHRPQDSHLSRA